MSVAGVLRTDGDNDREELFEIIKARSFRRGKFTLSSGLESDLYFNLKSTMMDPRGAHLAARAFLPFIRAANVQFTGGIAMGAVPLLGAIAALTGADGEEPARTFFVRKEVKGHGTRELIEGLSQSETLSGARVLAVDDVASTGGSVLEAIVVAREAGAIVDTALVIIDREMGGTEALAKVGVRLLSVFRESEFR